MTPQSIIDAFFNIGELLAGQMQPYAIHLWGLLVLVEIATIAISYMIGDSDNPPAVGWSIVRLLFTAGFGYWWITSSFTLGTTVIGSFDQIGRNLANGPGGLAPSQFFDTAIRIVKILWSAPSSSRLLPSIGLDILEGLLIIAIMIMMGFLGAAAAFSLIATMTIIGPGSIFVSFMPCRFTSSLSENYFIWLVRTGALLLGFYVVLRVIQDLAAKWYASLNGICAPVSTLLPLTSLGAPPTAVPAIACSTPIGVNDLITLFFCMLMMTIVGIGLPWILASMAGNGVHLGLENLASAKYLASGGAKHLSNAITSLSHRISQMTQNSQQQSTLNQRMAAGAAAAATMNSSGASPGSPGPSGPPGSSGGWNGRPAGPPIAPPPNSGSGNGGAALGYYPGRPGAQTRAEAVDITKLQKR